MTDHNQITQLTVWEVAGRRFDSEDEAKAYARRDAATASLAEVLYKFSAVTSRNDAAELAEDLFDYWPAIKAIME